MATFEEILELALAFVSAVFKIVVFIIILCIILPFLIVIEIINKL